MKRFLKTVFSVTALFLVLSCNVFNERIYTDPATSNETEPDYATVFPQDKINTLEITLTKAVWDSIKADMVTKAGYDFGTRSNQIGGGNIGGGGGMIDSTRIQGGMGGFPPLDSISGGIVGVPPTGFPGGNAGLPPNGNGGVQPGGNGGGGAVDIIKGDPIWVKSTVKLNGKEWKNVGFRLKGNSSLQGAWGSGIYKLPFKLEFDQFEDEIPSVKDQRFYGFKEFSMSPGYSDNSLMRDKIVNDLFRDAGIPTAKTAFYKLFIDFGDGQKYCGVYTMLEVIDDSMVKSQFGEKSGNIYKPESNFTTFSQSLFEKKSNETMGDYSDVQAVITALNATNRTTNPELWRTTLEKSFNVEHFLKYLAINNTIVNWDSYGLMAHNYYLYTPLKTGKVTWIPWDFNLSMPETTTNGIGNAPMGGMRGVSLEMTEVGSSWPLIRYLADDATYLAKYKTYVKEFNEKYFQANRMSGIIDKEANLISAAVSQEAAPYSYLSNYTNFTTAVAQLKQHVASRNQSVNVYLSK
ncbi:CotH kinase family protein [Lacihabitans sp. CS3-21]|uniref:CotH kinase family protein n=1 Tax=Lacihabitans sp. CS3-21 TaxID=2487332 RepID=UPI0020CB8C25|nr:CotH kinase family protein [Lacihabitans sp. CS3-21]